MEPISAARRREPLDALRRGTVPARGLDLFAVGMVRFGPVLARDFFGRRVQEFAKRRRFAAAGVQVSETETPVENSLSGMPGARSRSGPAARTGSRTLTVPGQ